MTIKKTLEEFDEKVQHFIKKSRPNHTQTLSSFEYGLYELFKDFIKESIIQALDEITPERKLPSDYSTKFYAENSHGTVGNGIVIGRNETIDQLEKNKSKFLNN